MSRPKRSNFQKYAMARLFMICGAGGALIDGWVMGSFAEGTLEMPIFRILLAVYCSLTLMGSFWVPFVQKHIYKFTCVFLYLAIAQFAYLCHAYKFNLDYTLSLMVCMMVFAVYMRKTWHLGAFFLFTFLATTASVLLTEDPQVEANRLMFRVGLGMVVGVGLFSMSRDMGRRMKKSEQLFRMLAENSADLVALHNDAGIVAYISPSIQDMLGYNQAFAVGKNAFLFIHPDDQSMVQQAYYERLYLKQEQVKLEYRLVRKDGSVIWVEAVGTPLPPQSGLPGRVMTTSRDISARKQVETDTLQYQENLLQINNELDQFAYVVSHDLKAPLRGISNLSSFVEEDLLELDGLDLPDDIRQNLKLLRSRVSRLEDLIDDVLTYSRAGRWPAPPEELNLLPLLQQIVDSMAIPEGFQVHLPAGIPPIVGAKIHLEQIFTNLIHNAWTHHHEAQGNITVGYASHSDFHVFSVTDDGPGIEEKYHQRIFEVFQQLQSRDRKGGTGVGLAVVRKIIQSAGGEIEVISEMGKGTTFKFTWPRNLQHEQEIS